MKQYVTISTTYVQVHVVVQFYPWVKVYFPLFQTHYQTLPYPKTNEIKFKPRIKLNHKIPTKENVMKLVFEGAVVTRLP